MKTIRDVILSTHQYRQPELDALRSAVLQQLETRTSAGHVTEPRLDWREIMYSLRWHLAGMAAAWVLVAVLNADPEQAPAMASLAHAPGEQWVQALRENRRQVQQLTAATELPVAAEPEPVIPGPRSEYARLTAVA
jgi:hypothetical protein